MASAIVPQWDARGKMSRIASELQNSWVKPLNMSTTIQGKMCMCYENKLRNFNVKSLVVSRFFRTFATS